MESMSPAAVQHQTWLLPVPRKRTTITTWLSQSILSQVVWFRPLLSIAAVVSCSGYVVLDNRGNRIDVWTARVGRGEAWVCGAVLEVSVEVGLHRIAEWGREYMLGWYIGCWGKGGRGGGRWIDLLRQR
jgi:hypothetical protein